jgi:RHS repeat-associated protein
MRRAICLLTAAAMALQATGLALASYTYDDAGRTETIDKFGETTTFEYDEASRPEKMTYDTGAYALYTYDGRSRIKAVEHKNSSNTLLRKETNVYDPASRITSRYEGPASGGVTTTFGYDDAGQLLSESSSGYSASYTYDANGNRTNRTVNGVSETYTVDDSDKLTSVTWSSGGNNYAKEYAYHWSGRVTGITYKTNSVTTSTETLTWNKENRLISRGTDTYTYNGLNTRVAKSDGGGSFTFKRAGAGQTAPVLHDGAANYLPGISEKRSGTSTFLHSGIKNGQLQTNSSQSNTATNRYDAFGNVLATTGTWKGPFGYGGKFGYQTDEADMQLLGDRYYDPTIGRFLSRDAAQDGRNWYVYCSNAPTARYDATGLAEVQMIWYEAVPGTGFTHAGIVVVDNMKSGKPLVWSFAGGADKFGICFPFCGPLVPKSGPWASGTQDYNSVRKKGLVANIILANDDIPASKWIDKLQQIENEMFSENVPYYDPYPWSFDPFANSNSYAREMTDRAKLMPSYERAISKRGDEPKMTGWNKDPWPKK